MYRTLFKLDEEGKLVKDLCEDYKVSEDGKTLSLIHISGLNNFNVYSILQRKSSSCFGFTSEETKELLESYDMISCEATVKEW